MAHTTLVGGVDRADLRAACREQGCQAGTGRLGDPALPTPPSPTRCCRQASHRENAGRPPDNAKARLRQSPLKRYRRETLDAPLRAYGAIARTARRGCARPGHFRNADIFHPSLIQFAQRNQWRKEPKARIHIDDTRANRSLCHTTDK